MSIRVLQRNATAFLSNKRLRGALQKWSDKNPHATLTATSQHCITVEDDANSVQRAAESFLTTVVDRHFRYENVRVFVFDSTGKGDRLVAVSFLGEPPQLPVHTSSVPVVTFGLPLLSQVFRSMFTCFTLKCTSFEFIQLQDGSLSYAFQVELFAWTQQPMCGTPPLIPCEPEKFPGGDCTDLVVFILATRNETSSNCEVLLMLEKGNGGWFQPAGHVERGQSFEDAACAEMLEETGFTLKRKTILPIDLIYGNCGYDPYPYGVAPLHVIYWGAIDKTIAQITAVDGDGVAWVDLTVLRIELMDLELSRKYRNPHEMLRVMDSLVKFLKFRGEMIPQL